MLDPNAALLVLCRGTGSLSGKRAAYEVMGATGSVQLVWVRGDVPKVWKRILVHSVPTGEDIRTQHDHGTCVGDSTLLASLLTPIVFAGHRSDCGTQPHSVQQLQARPAQHGRPYECRCVAWGPSSSGAVVVRLAFLLRTLILLGVPGYCFRSLRRQAHRFGRSG